MGALNFSIETLDALGNFFFHEINENLRFYFGKKKTQSKSRAKLKA